MNNKKITAILSKTVVFALITCSSSIQAFAKDGDFHKVGINKGGFKNIYLNNKDTLFDLLINTSSYQYEVYNKFYDATVVNEVFASNPGASIETIYDKIAKNSAPVESKFSVSSISAVSPTTVKVEFDKIMTDADKIGLTYTFNGVVVGGSRVIYSGTGATLTGLTLVSTVDGKTPAYEVLVKVGPTQLSKQSIIWNKSGNEKLVIDKVMPIPDITVVKNAKPELPSIVDVLYKDGSEGKEPITWVSVSTSTIGLKKVLGKINGSAVTTVINVNVVDIECVKNISLEHYPIVDAHLVNIETESIVAKVSINGKSMYYSGNNSFELYTVLTRGSIAKFNLYDANGNLIQTKDYLVEQ